MGGDDGWCLQKINPQVNKGVKVVSENVDT